MIEYVSHMGSDLTVVNAARVSLGKNSKELTEKDAGLLSYLMREKHASPFEHCSLTVLVTTSIAVSREWMRHRTQSFNEFSTRYSEAPADDYFVPVPRKQTGKPGAYKFEDIEDPELQEAVSKEIGDAYERAYESYQYLINLGVAKEVARSVLPLCTSTKFYATSNLRNWLNFLSLRTNEQALREIRSLAFEIEGALLVLFPHTMQAWNDNGRQQI